MLRSSHAGSSTLSTNLNHNLLLKLPWDSLDLNSSLRLPWDLLEYLGLPWEFHNTYDKKAINLVDGTIFKMVGSKPTNLAMLHPFMPKLELLDDFFVNSTTHMRKKARNLN